MQKESDDSIVYVPTMHREFFPEGFSGGVKPLWPGLSSRYWGQRNPDAWHKISLPYTPTEAAACLAELAQLDEAGGPFGYGGLFPVHDSESFTGTG